MDGVGLVEPGGVERDRGRPKDVVGVPGASPDTGWLTVIPRLPSSSDPREVGRRRRRHPGLDETAARGARAADGGGVERRQADTNGWTGERVGDIDARLPSVAPRALGVGMARVAPSVTGEPAATVPSWAGVRGRRDRARAVLGPAAVGPGRRGGRRVVGPRRATFVDCLRGRAADGRDLLTVDAGAGSSGRAAMSLVAVCTVWASVASASWTPASDGSGSVADPRRRRFGCSRWRGTEARTVAGVVGGGSGLLPAIVARRTILLTSRPALPTWRRVTVPPCGPLGYRDRFQDPVCPRAHDRRRRRGIPGDARCLPAGAQDSPPARPRSQGASGRWLGRWHGRAGPGPPRSHVGR